MPTRSRWPSRTIPIAFVGFFMLDPTREDAIAYAKRALDEGLRTICLFPAMHGYSLHDPNGRRRVRARRIAPRRHRRARSPSSRTAGCCRSAFARSSGCRATFEIRFGNPLDLHGLAMKYPAVPIIIPHFGAGMLREALMLADSCANVHLDTSSSNSWIKYTPGLTLEQVFKTALDVVGPDRLIFGTDSSFFPRGWNGEVHQKQKSALDAIGVSADVQNKIFSENFARLFS